MNPWLRLGIALFLALDLALAGFLGWNLYREYADRAPKHDELAQWIGDEDLSEQERKALYVQKLGEALALTYVQGECVAKDGRMNLRFSNGEESECAVMLELLSLDSGETLAQTDLLDPGYHVESMELLRDLPSGSFECIAKLKFYWMKNDAYVGEAARHVLLTVP